jgi:hypothetical protein
MADIEKDIVLRVKSETDQATGQFKNLKQELRSIENELNKMASAGQTGTEAFRKLQQRAGEVKDQVGDTKNAIKALSSDTFRLDAFAQGAQGIAGGFAAAQGAMALFGSENKAVEEAIKKTQGAMALLQGVTAITNILQKDSAFSLMFLGKAQKENAVATNIATNATKGFSRALIATGIGAIIVLIGTLVAYWDDLKEAVGGVSKETENYIEVSKQDTEQAQKKYDLTKDTENVLKLQGKSQREILNIKIKETDAIIAGIKNQIKGQQLATKQAVEASKRNQEIAKGVIMALFSPIKAVTLMVDGLINGLIETANFFGAGIDFKLNLSSFDQLLAETIFNPEKVAEEGKKTEEELQKSLDKITNEQAGFKLEIQKMDEEALKKQQEAEKKAREAEEKARKDKEKKDEELKKKLEQNAKDFQDRTTKEYEDSKKSSDAYYDHLINNAKLNGQSTEQLELHKLQNLLQIQKDYGQSTIATEDQIALKKKEIADKELEAKKELDEKERQMDIDAQKTSLQLALDSDRLKFQKKKELLKQAYLDGIILEKEYNDAIEKLDLASAQRRQEIFDYVVQSSQKTFSTILAFRENQMNEELRMAKGNEKEQEAIRKRYFEQNKKVQVAEAIIQAIAGAQGAFAQTSKSPITSIFPAAPYIAAATALATGLANVQKIRQTQFQGSSSASSSSSSSPNLSPSSQATQTQAIGSTQLQLDAQGNLQQQSVRTYVLETDISDKQKRSQRLQRTATLGK